MKNIENKVEAKAHVKLQRESAQKARLVADLIRGKNTSLAIGILKNTNKKASPILLKLLNSAIANAVNNHGMSGENLFISQILVNEGPTIKRFQPRSRGRAFKIFKRTSNLSITLGEK